MRVNGTEMYLRRFKIHTPVVIPASALGKVDWIRVRRDTRQGDMPDHVPGCPTYRPVVFG
jgi:hypothetical protein